MQRKTIRAIGATMTAVGAIAFWAAPVTMGKRIAVRNRLEFQRRSLDRIENSREMADRDRFRGAKWLTSRLSPDSEAEADLETIRDRSRDLYLNDPIAAGYVKTQVTNVVGTGFGVQARVKKTKGVIKKKQAKRFNESAESLFRRWSKQADRSGRKSLWQILRLAQRCRARDGESFVVFSDAPLPGKPIPLALEVVSVTRVATPPEQEGKPSVRLGIERDADGNPVAYYIRTVDPNDTKNIEDHYDRVPADRVCHLYEEEEADQSRGLPPACSSAGTLKDLKDHDEAVLIGRQVEACFGMIHKTSDPLGAAIGAATGTDANNNRLEEISPGFIQRIGMDEEIEFANPNRSSGGDHGVYMDGQYHKVAAGLNCSHESLTKNFGKASYSSARAVRLDEQAEYQCSQKFTIEQVLDRVWPRLIVEGVLADELTITPREYLKVPWVYEDVEWVLTGWPRVDKKREAEADALAVESGFSSRTLINKAHGLDEDELRQQRLREAMADADDKKTMQEYRKTIGLREEENSEGRDKEGAVENRIAVMEQTARDARAAQQALIKKQGSQLGDHMRAVREALQADRANIKELYKAVSAAAVKAEVTHTAIKSSMDAADKE